MDKHILVVEDSPTQARYVALILKSAGYTTTVASTGEQALELASCAGIDPPSSSKLDFSPREGRSRHFSKSGLSPTALVRKTKAQIQKAAVHSPTFHLQISNYTSS